MLGYSQDLHENLRAISDLFGFSFYVLAPQKKAAAWREFNLNFAKFRLIGQNFPMGRICYVCVTYSGIVGFVQLRLYKSEKNIILLSSMTAKEIPVSNPAVAYFNRELSWLAFNRRVLEQATAGNYPILERMRYLCFVCSNLDEFFEIRVAGLVQQVESGLIEVGMDGLGPKEQLRRILDISSSLVRDKYVCWNEQMIPALAEQGVFFKPVKKLSHTQRAWVETYFQEQVYPVLTPLAIDPAHPFPQLVNKSLNLLVHLEDPEHKHEEPMMAIVPVPRILPRVVAIEGGEVDTYSFLGDIIKNHVNCLFPGYTVKNTWAFRITRNSDLYIEEEEAENLLQYIEEELHKMRRGDAVRLEIESGVTEDILSKLLEYTQLTHEFVFQVNGPINLMRLMSVYDLIDRPDLKFQPFKAFTPPELSDRASFFDHLGKRDFLLHHPYDSFNPVVNFIENAAQDPMVFAIKQTLYRTSGDSPIIEALKNASRNGKQVTALVELKARFDELNNIHWARELEEEGVHVVYGLVGLKTHCKCCLVVRREGNSLNRYIHLGTGNYNPKTAKSYTDLSYFTSNPKLTQDVADLFNTLTGFGRSPSFSKLLVAPFELHNRMQGLIQREAQNASEGKPARIFAKVNSLIDRDTIDNLYKASKAGVQIDLVVRGICGLVPGVLGMSENIRVRSILGRFLEHSRLFCFENSGNPEVFMGSADWMPRNFFRRIEVVFPVECPELRKEVLENIIPQMLQDNTQAKILQPTGAYRKAEVQNSTAFFCQQDYFIEQAAKRQKAADAIEVV